MNGDDDSTFRRHAWQRAAVTPPKPTRVQKAIELALFTFFGGALLIAAIAIIVSTSKAHRVVPNRIDAGIAADRVNVLVITTSRETSEALMLVSMKPSTGEAAVLSIPNELWVRLGRYGARRLGSGFKVGSTSGYPGGGAGLVSDTISNVLEQPIHAFVRLSTSDLRRAIDAVGGVDVDVHRGAYEARTGDRYTRGRHHLDGKRALRFAFSRRMVGPANDRFERERRQRQLLVGLIGKLPAMDMASIAVRDETVTNLTKEQMVWMRQTLAGSTARALTFEPYVDVFAVSTIVDQGEALRPRAGDFEQLQQIVANVFAPAR
jgi:LCP family protein required for cell wall assembly